MEVRYIDLSKDYDKLCEWWSFWRFNPMPISSLPTTGLMVSKDGVDLCAGFIYLTNSDMCWIEFIVCNPQERNKEVREASIIKCLNDLCGVAKEVGCRVAYSSLKHQGLQNKYLSCGFVEGSKNYNEYIKIL